MNIPEVRFINIEYLFYKVYDFFAGIFGYGSVNPTVTHLTFWEWIKNLFSHSLAVAIIIISILCILFYCVIIYVRLHISELDAERKKKYNDHFVAPAPKAVGKSNPRWEYVVSMFASTNANDWRIGIIEADNMLDELLISYNFPGENLGERLKNVNTNVMPTVQSAWEAHRVRNRIAHEGSTFSLSEREAQLTKRHYEFVFRDAGII